MNILDKFRLDGKVAIITGASKGIGEAIARAYGQVGAKVVISSRKQEDLDRVAEDFKKEGIEVTAIQAHNGKKEDLESLVRQTIEKYGRLDIVVNNAATNPAFGPVVATEDSAFDKIMEVNLKGAFMLGKVAYPELKKNQGNVINISSVAGIKPDEKTGIYSVSKSGLISLTKVMARDWGADGVRVNAICPGLIKTKMSEALWKNENVFKQIMHFIPMRRMAEPEEMAGLALFLASDAASYCTGGVYVADGGLIV
ncbi:MAG: glucose 1-dehydrogenase [Microscillaceae bacterium]|jgi:NAD(P)-dependent dehydrogenase (short-subunit alcohol dehydrogenase family)|nr:glucose 1-dehydrogenase [Microscillaceae bacterium]